MILSHPILRPFAVMVMVVTAVVYTAGGTPVTTSRTIDVATADAPPCHSSGFIVGRACIRPEARMTGGAVFVKPTL
ncbi:MAG: hypothetical protein ACE368_04020 [Paracoccaceae bacterium]